MNTTDAVNDFLSKLNITQTESKTKKKKKPLVKKDNNNDNNNKPTNKKVSKMGKLALEHLKKVEEEETRLKLIYEEELRKEEEEKARLLKEEEDKKQRKQKKKEKLQIKKELGVYKTQNEKEKMRYIELKREQLLKGNIKKTEDIIIKPLEVLKVNNYREFNPKFKSIITCILGHVDAGKTSLLDKIIGTHIQKKEAGNITQQLGSWFISREDIITKTESFGNHLNQVQILISGLIIIDTPGHEAFTNLRKVGSSICNIVILVIDIVHGLQSQTIESMKILRDAGVPCIIALNKIDKLYGWKTSSINNCSFKETFKNQDSNVHDEFDTRLNKIIVQIMEQGFNAKLYWKNDSVEDTINICPISAKTGEGLSDLLTTIITFGQTNLTDKITYSNELKCMLMDTTKISGMGMTIDAILCDGLLQIGDTITIETINGKLNTTIRNLLISNPLIKNDFIQQTTVKASSNVKIIVSDLDTLCISGSYITKFIPNDIINNNVILTKFKLEDYGVSINASTMGTLETLVNYLQKECKPSVPICQINVGPVMKKHVLKNNLLNEKTLPEYKSILAFDVQIEEDANVEAKQHKIKIFESNIIYHLFDNWTKYKKELLEQRKLAVKDKMTFPCILKILPNCIFNKRNPLVFGVNVIEGNLHVGTELYEPTTNTVIGKVIGIQINNSNIEIGKQSLDVCIKVDNNSNPNIEYGKHFDSKNMLYSKITRESLDILKEYYVNDVTKEDFSLVVKLKKILNVS
jgi:translation initiation factor 5B